MYKIMTPGPTQVSSNVLSARSIPCTNPDLDVTFVEYYKETCDKYSRLLHTECESLILSGEGILGLEAACATLTEPGDKVLVIDNGIYGAGFADFVTMYGGIPTVYTCDYLNEINVEDLSKYLENNHDFKYATVVHCDTPSGMRNDIKRICPLLKSYGILTLVDSVSAMFGEELNFDEYKIDILCGGSQKVISAPPGLTLVTISEDAKAAFQTRKTNVQGFYLNLTIFDTYYEDKWFPYTMPISDIYGLRQALDNIEAEPDIVNRHKKIAEATRHALTAAGLQLHLNSGYCNTVTVFDVPTINTTADSATTCEAILEGMKAEGIMLAGSFGDLTGKVIRIGHMGVNANIPDMSETLSALDKVLRSLGLELKVNLASEFEEFMK